MAKESAAPRHTKRMGGWQTYKRIMAYTRPYRRHILFGCVCMGIYAGFSLVPAQAVRYIIDDVINPAAKLSNRAFFRQMGLGLGAIVLAYAGHQTFNYYGRLTMRYVGGRVVHDLRTATHRYLQNLSLEYFDSRRTGEIMSRLTADVDQVEVLVNHVIDNILINSIQSAVVLGFLFMVDWRLALVALIPVPAMVYMVKRFGKPARVRFRGARKSFGVMSAKLQDNLSGIRVIKTFNQEAHEAARFAASSDRYRKRSLDGARISMLFGMRMKGSTVTGSVLVLGFGGWLVAHGQMTFGTLVAFYFMYLQPYLYENATALANLADPILRAITSANRVFTILDAIPTVQNAPNAKMSPPLRGEVEFRGVSFRYGEGDYVLANLDLHVMPGTRVALVGKSGAGKTSFVNLITRFYDPIEGTVLVDGVDVRTYTQESLRRQMAMVLQDVFLFNGTVKENMRYGRLDATDEEIVAAAKMANAHEFIDTLPDGYNTQIGERGVKLSGGQKQRLSIARAILADPKVLILDEATSSVDSESEILIHEAMDRLMHGRTTFIIAHRLSTVRNADTIIGMEHGRIREIGNHEQLVALDNGVYRQLYELQQRAEAPIHSWHEELDEELEDAPK